jgi:hypothetical protein
MGGGGETQTCFETVGQSCPSTAGITTATKFSSTHSLRLRNTGLALLSPFRGISEFFQA